MSIEAMKQALEALEKMVTPRNFQTHQFCQKAYDNLRQAIAEAEKQEPDDGFTQALIERDEYHAIADELAEMISQITGEDIGEHTSANFPWRNALDAAENWLCRAPTAPVQEPVAWRWRVGDSGWQLEDIQPRSPTAQPLYTHPPKREWVGLTDEEIKHMMELFVVPPHHVEMVARAIEAKLKAKNGFPQTEKNG